MWLRELASRLLLGNARVLWRSAGFHRRWSAELLRRRAKRSRVSAEGSRPGEEHRDALLCGDEGRNFLQPNDMENRELDMAPMAAAATKTSHPTGGAKRQGKKGARIRVPREKIRRTGVHGASTVRPPWEKSRGSGYRALGGRAERIDRLGVCRGARRGIEDRERRR